MSVGLVIFLVVLVALVAALAWLYRGLMQLERRCIYAWSQVEEQLAKRQGLVDNLLAASRRCADVDVAFQTEEVERALEWVRRASTTDERVRAENALTSAVGALAAHKANCADLVHSTALMSAKRKAAASDTTMRYARQSYNDAVAAYDEARARFPYSAVAALFGGSFPKLETFDPKPPAHPHAKIKGASGEKPAR